MAGMWKPGEYEEFIGVKGKRIVATKLESRTHFKKSRNAATDNWEWYWAKETPNGETVAVGGEGYDRAAGATNGFFASEGVPWEPQEFDWQTGAFNIPDGYQLQKIADNHYVITHYTDEGE